MKKLFLLLVAVLTIGLCASAQTRTVNGTVLDATNGDPLIGASVTAHGATTGVATDADGAFTITVPSSVTKLTVSYVGYETQHVTIGTGALTVKLQPSSNVLSDVIAVAYGTATRSSFTGSAAVVDGAQIEQAQVSNPLNALKGQVAGVQINNASGAPGADSPSILIRGISSISAGTSPLIVVDGTPFSGNMNTINTNDIASMTILKDAASNALYGARGANGVILITTKRAKAGEARVTVDVRLGSNSKAQQEYNYITDPAKYYEAHYRSLYNYAQANNVANPYLWANQNLAVGNSQNPYSLQYNVYDVPAGQMLIGQDGKINPNATMGRLVNYQGTEYYLTPDNWLDAAYSNSLRQEYNLSVAKASESSNFYLSAGYLDNEGITPESGYSRFTGRLAADTQAKEWMKVAGDLSYTHYERDAFGSDEGSSAGSGNPFAAGSAIAPIYPLYIRNADGSIRKDENGLIMYDYGNLGNAGLTRPPFGGNVNPIGESILNKNKQNGNAVSATGSIEIRFLNDFRFTAKNNLDFIEYDNTSFTNPYYGQKVAQNGILYRTKYRRLNYTFQQLLNWGHKYGLHNVEALAGHETYFQKTTQLQGAKSNMFDPHNYELANMITTLSAYSVADSYNNEGWIFRGQYDYDSKYFFSASFRRDASSRFHPKHRWGNFWSAGGAWIISKENFLNEVTWIDLLKIKASYGEQGNDNIGDFLYTNTYTVENSNGSVSVVPDLMGNENITWETGGTFNAGVEFSFFNERLSGSVEGFIRKTSDMLFYFPLAPSMGWSGYYANVGDMSNKGIEIDLHGRVLDLKDYSIDLNFNMTWYKNRITRLPDERKTSRVDKVDGYHNGSYFYGEGEPMYTFHMKKYAGVDPKTGESLWWKSVPVLDAEGKNQYDADGDLITKEETTTNFAEATYHLCGSALAPVYGGFGANFRVKWFDLGLNFNYQIGGKTYDSTYASLMGSPYDGNVGKNFHKDIYKAWTPENPNSDIPRFQYGDQYVNGSSDRWLTNASYLSLQNINFGFTLPENLAQKLYLKSLRLYLSADNVALWSKRKGLDPRLSVAGGGNATYYSPIRTISGGINITF